MQHTGQQSSQTHGQPLSNNMFSSNSSNYITTSTAAQVDSQLLPGLWSGSAMDDEGMHIDDVAAIQCHYGDQGRDDAAILYTLNTHGCLYVHVSSETSICTDIV
jgi:hypothetical protein